MVVGCRIVKNFPRFLAIYEKNSSHQDRTTSCKKKQLNELFAFLAFGGETEDVNCSTKVQKAS